MISYRQADLKDRLRPGPIDATEEERKMGTLYKKPFGGNLNNMRWAVNPDGYKESIKFWVSNPHEIPESKKREGQKIMISFTPQDQFCTCIS